MKKIIIPLLAAMMTLTACEETETLTYDLGPATIEYPSNYVINNVQVGEDGSFGFACETTHEEELSKIDVAVFPDMDLMNDENARRELLSVMTENGLAEYYKKINSLTEKNSEKGGITDVQKNQFDESGCVCVTNIKANYAGEDILASIEAYYIDDWKSVVYVIYETTEGSRDMDKLRGIMETLKLK